MKNKPLIYFTFLCIALLAIAVIYIASKDELSEAEIEYYSQPNHR